MVNELEAILLGRKYTYLLCGSKCADAHGFALTMALFKHNKESAEAFVEGVKDALNKIETEL